MLSLVKLSLIKKLSRDNKRLLRQKQRRTRRTRRTRRHTRKNTRRHRGGDYRQFTDKTLDGEPIGDGALISVPGIGTMGVDAYTSYVNNLDMMGTDY
jgi:hypothetical protein